MPSTQPTNQPTIVPSVNIVIFFASCRVQIDFSKNCAVHKYILTACIVPCAIIVFLELCRVHI